MENTEYRDNKDYGVGRSNNDHNEVFLKSCVFFLP